MKRKTLTIAICFLALISIVSIGFASWVISRPTTEQSAAGSITAESVAVEGYTLSLEWLNLPEGDPTPTQPVIHFGKPATYTVGQNDWLKNNNGTVESLTCELKITVSNKSNIGNGLILSLKALDKELTNESTAFGKALNANYIAMPKVTVGSNAAVDYSVENKISIASTDFVSDVNNPSSASCTVVIEFGWGSEVDSKNPLVYYNQMEFEDDEEFAAAADKAQIVLEAIYAIATEDTTYKVIVAPAPATPQE